MLLIPGLLPVFSIYQLYLQIKDMKIWQQVLAQQMKPVRPDPGATMGRPSSPSHRWGKSLTEGASQIPGTNDSTLRQLKPPHPSHIEGPISPRRLSLVTYPNPRPSSLTTPHNECIKATPNMIWARTSLTCLAMVWEPCLGVLCH